MLNSISVTPILRAIALPKIIVDGREFVPQSDGWRDSLCSLIGRTVTSITLDERIFKFFVSSETFVEIQLSPLGPEGEAMHFLPTGTGFMDIW